MNLAKVLGIVGLSVLSFNVKAFSEELSSEDVAVSADSLPRAVEDNATSADGYGAWRCDAWPSTGFGVPTYWISPNLVLARFNAVQACNVANGVYCFYRCYPIYY